MKTEQRTITRKDVASMLQITSSTVGRRERELGLDKARISPTRRLVRYAVGRLRRQRWFEMIEED